MSKITGIKQGKNRTKRFNVYVDDKFAMSVSPETVQKTHIKTGQELGKAALEALAEKEICQRCFNSAARLLGYRPRSEAEMRQRLARHGYDNSTIDKTLEKLKESGLVDDGAFARYWVENRDLNRPRGKRLTKMELQKKGLEADIIEQAVSAIDEKESAYRAAQKRAGRLAALDQREFRLRLGQYLARRGFNYAIIKEITLQAWEELRKK
jgi:regulatory protein